MSFKRGPVLGILALAAVFFGGRYTVTHLSSNQFRRPAVILDGFETNSRDWVRLYNTSDEPFDLSSLMLTDGGNKITFHGVTIPGKGTWTVGRFKDKNRLSDLEVNDWWGESKVSDWGFSKNGEAILLAGLEGQSVVDFVYAPRMAEGQTAGRGHDEERAWSIIEKDGSSRPMHNCSATPIQGAEVYRTAEILGHLSTLDQLNSVWGLLFGLGVWLARKFGWSDRRESSEPIQSAAAR